MHKYENKDKKENANKKVEEENGNNKKGIYEKISSKFNDSEDKVACIFFGGLTLIILFLLYFVFTCKNNKH